MRCPFFNRCGGCRYQDLPYPEGQLELKRAELKRVLGLDVDIVPSPTPYGYRNRMDYVCAFSKIGLRERGSHKEVVDIDECHLLPSRFLPLFRELRQAVRDSGIQTYNYLTHKGYLRYLIFRVAANTPDLMVTFVTASEDAAIMPLLEKAAQQASSVHWLVNDGLADTSFGRLHRHLKNAYIMETIGRYSYKIGPNTFFQNNGLLCESLFSFVRENVSGPTLDLFCGAGAISIFISDAAESVLGVELEGPSIELAAENAALNSVQNVRFEASDARQWLLLNKECRDFSTIVVDPPRTGMGGKVARKVARLNAEKIVYVSCNAATLRDDLVWLTAAYQIEAIRAFDMFPQTPHVEVVTVMRRIH
ncbi:MAG: 23S rRNA (uracil(1939)-C(5))-methyltransferase RlmD [Fibrobacterota bacterium]